MTEKEFKQFVASQRRKGKSDEEILTVFALMYREDGITREQFMAIATALGFEVSKEFQALSDDEFKKAILN